VKYSNVQGGLYIQDDIKVRKELTITGGVRYEAQTHVPDALNFGRGNVTTVAPHISAFSGAGAGGGGGNATLSRVQVELVCASGTVYYDPYNFQAFDQSGRLFELAVEGAGSSPLLEIGTLHAGERIRGTLAFDMPRGEATLLMSDESDQTVTALRVPD